MVNIERVLPIFIHIGTLHVHTWFAIVHSLAVDIILGTLIIYQSIDWIFFTDGKVVLCHYFDDAAN